MINITGSFEILGDQKLRLFPDALTFPNSAVQEKGKPPEPGKTQSFGPSFMSATVLDSYTINIRQWT